MYANNIEYFVYVYVYLYKCILRICQNIVFNNS